MSAADLHLNLWPAPADLCKFFSAPGCDPTRLLALMLWREGRGELGSIARLAIGCVARNRTQKPARFGVGYPGVILKPLQFSSFNTNDPQYKAFPKESDARWQECLRDAKAVLIGYPDPTGGATHYFDSSMDKDPPRWAIDGELMHNVDIDHLRFYGPAFPDVGSQPDGHAEAA
jgi:N-acetylmuramoyl-L-alanine amidase